MSSILDIPEVAALDARRSLVRIPPEIDVPLTPPRAATDRHGRFPPPGPDQPAWAWCRWSIRRPSTPASSTAWACIRLALLYLEAAGPRRAVRARPSARRTPRCSSPPPCCTTWATGRSAIRSKTSELPSVPSHELFANSFLLEGEIGDVLRHDWGINPRDVVALLSEKPRDAAARILASMLSGPIDIDKMDYLFRDSLHAGVPYGRHFDQQRLLGSLCLNQAGDGLAITDKGKTAAELMVFARYVMFSEVYWHHGVRAATAMFQRAFYLLHGALDLDALFRMTEHEMIAELAAGGRRRPGRRIAPRPVRPHAAALQAAGAVQLLRAARNSTSGWPGGRIPGWRPVAEQFAALASTALGRVVAPHEILFDAPPVAREVQIRRRDPFSQGRPLAAAGRGLAGGPHAGHRAVRRLREARPHLRPSPPGRRSPPLAEPAATARPGDRADRPLTPNTPDKREPTASSGDGGLRSTKWGDACWPSAIPWPDFFGGVPANFCCRWTI